MDLYHLFVLIVISNIAGTSDLPDTRHLPVPGINGEDNRTLVDSRQTPWSSTGRPGSTRGGFRTTPRRISITTHCPWNPCRNDWLPPCSLHFLLGGAHGNYQCHHRISGYRLPPSAHSGPASPFLSRFSNDRAILGLQAPLPVGVPVLALIQTRFENISSRQFSQAVYSRDHRRLCNHLHSIHAISLAISLANLGKPSNRLAVLAALPDSIQGIVVHIEIDYLKKARGLLTTHGDVTLPTVNESIFIRSALISLIAVVRPSPVYESAGRCGLATDIQHYDYQ